MYDLRLDKGRHIESAGAEPRRNVSDQAAKGENGLSITEFLRILRRRIWIVGVIMALVAGTTLTFSLLKTPEYEGSIMLLVGQAPPELSKETPMPPIADAFSLQQITRTMAEGVKSRPVAEDVIRQFNLSMTPQDFLQHVSVKQVQQTQYIEVTYTDPSPERAQQVANAIGDVFSDQVSDVSLTAQRLDVTVWARAETPDEPASPNPILNTLTALVLGLMLGTGLAFLLEYTDDSWRSPEEAEQVSGVPTFGVIPEFKAATTKQGGH